MSKEASAVDDDVIDVNTEVEGPFAIARVDARDMLAEFEAAAQLHPKLVQASIRMTHPQDWIAMGDKVYLQSTGVERMATPWGLVFGEPKVTREDYPDGEYAYVVVGPIGSRKTGVYYRAIQGGRSSRDPFFDRFDEDRPDKESWNQLTSEQRAAWKKLHRLPVDPMEVRKAAFTNWQCRGASMVTGMRGLTEKDLQEQGLSGIKKVSFGSGARGGDTTPGDLKQESVALWNEILKRTGGNLADAKQVLKEITSYPERKDKDGKVLYRAFDGLNSHEGFKDVQKVRIALSKLKEHAAFGDKAAAREPGGEG